MALVKQHSSSDMQTIKKNSAPSNVKIMQYYQTNIGISCQQTKLQSYHGKSWEPQVMLQISKRCLLSQ